MDRDEIMEEARYIVVESVAKTVIDLAVGFSAGFVCAWVVIYAVGWLV